MSAAICEELLLKLSKSVTPLMLIVWWMAGLLDADIPDAGITTPGTLGAGDPPLRRSRGRRGGFRQLSTGLLSNVNAHPICHNLLMCGRYRLSRRKQIVDEYFASVSGEQEWSPRYNIAPTQPVPVIRQNPKEHVRELSLVRWGLVPSWVKDPSIAARMINARSETASAKPAFRDALKSRRCLIPADGFYEWSRTGKGKQPYCFEVNAGELFAFAGIWDRWRDPSSNAFETCSILTTTPNALTAPVHDRMPVILEPDSYDLWLDPWMRDMAAASELLKPCDARLMRCYPISTRINHVANDDEGCSALVELAQIQNPLFS